MSMPATCGKSARTVAGLKLNTVEDFNPPTTYGVEALLDELLILMVRRPTFGSLAQLRDINGQAHAYDPGRCPDPN